MQHLVAVALMSGLKPEALEEIQRIVVRLIATSPAGVGLSLIGGFRYRFLNQSARLSSDIDYHWEGDLDKKQEELEMLFSRRLLPEAKRLFDFDGSVRRGGGLGDEGAFVRVVELAFWLPGSAGRLEIPVDITRIVCADPIGVRTFEGNVYPTPSDADVVESKVISIVNRRHIEHRDLVDLFLFSSHLRPDSGVRLQRKFASLGIASEAIQKQLRDFAQYPDYHVKSIGAVVAGQLEAIAAAQIEASGGARNIFETVVELLTNQLKLGAGGAS